MACLNGFGNGIAPARWTATLSDGLNVNIDTADYSCVSSGVNGQIPNMILQVNLSDLSTLSFEVSLDGFVEGASPRALPETVTVREGFKKWESAQGGCTVSVLSDDKLHTTNANAYRVEGDLSCSDPLTGGAGGPLSVGPMHFVTLQNW